MEIYVAISGLYAGAGEFAFACLQAQTTYNFTVVLLDWNLDPALLGQAEQFSDQTGVDVLRVPYRPAPGGRCFDWSQWNSPCLLAESEEDLIFRFQSWRLIPSNLIAELHRVNQSVGFVRAPKTFLGLHEVDDFMRNDQPVFINPDQLYYGFYATYGDWAIKVHDLLAVNGVDEVFTAVSHAEDLDFENRWRNAVLGHQILGAQGWMGMMLYVTPETRAILAPDATQGKAKAEESYQHPCDRCRQKWPELQAINDPNVAFGQIPNREGMVDLGKHFHKRWFMCMRCDTPICHSGTPDFRVLNHDCYARGEFLAPVGIAGKWGRYLRKARQKSLRLPMDQRLEYIGASYTDPEILRL